MSKSTYSYDDLKSIFSPLMRDFKAECYNVDGKDAIFLRIAAENKPLQCYLTISLTIPFNLSELKNCIDAKKSEGQAIPDLEIFKDEFAADLAANVEKYKDFLSPFNGSNDYNVIAEIYVNNRRGAITGRKFGL